MVFVIDSDSESQAPGILEMSSLASLTSFAAVRDAGGQANPLRAQLDRGILMPALLTRDRI